MTNTTDTPTDEMGPVGSDAECDPGLLLNQIGRGNLAAISGLRWSRIMVGDRCIGVDLPVTGHYRVHVTYQADDTYTVTRIRRTVRRVGGLEGFKVRYIHQGYRTGIYADNVGEVARAASNYFEPFGQTEEGS